MEFQFNFDVSSVSEHMWKNLKFNECSKAHLVQTPQLAIYLVKQKAHSKVMPDLGLHILYTTLSTYSKHKEDEFGSLTYLQNFKEEWNFYSDAHNLL